MTKTTSTITYAVCHACVCVCMLFIIIVLHVVRVIGRSYTPPLCVLLSVLIPVSLCNICMCVCVCRYKPRPSDDPYVRRPDITLAKEKLDWAPVVPLREGIVFVLFVCVCLFVCLFVCLCVCLSMRGENLILLSLSAVTVVSLTFCLCAYVSVCAYVRRSCSHH